MQNQHQHKNKLSIKKLIIASLACSQISSTQFSFNTFKNDYFNRIKEHTGTIGNFIDNNDFTIQEIFNNFQESNQYIWPKKQYQVPSFKVPPSFQVPQYNFNPYDYQPVNNGFYYPNSNKETNNPFFNFFHQNYGYGQQNAPLFAFKSSLAQIDRSIDGSGNNELKKYYGAKDTALSRIGQANYKDGLSIPVDNLPNARDVSNKIGEVQSNIQQNRQQISMAFTIWGQFLDHDLSLTEANGFQQFPIRLKKNDKFYNKDRKQIGFTRSKFIGRKLKSVRKHPNQVTSWLDGSQIYGSDEKLAAKLRTFKKGKLKTSSQGQLLFIEQGLFVGGDIRVNQNIFLTIFHTIFVRQHNLLCDIIAFQKPGLSDQQIYQSARNYVIGLLQKITFQDFLPKLIGQQQYFKLIGQYKGYNKQIDPSISLEFTTAAFRFGHSLLVSQYPSINFRGIQTQLFKLRDLFFNPQLLTPKRLSQMLRGLTRTPAKQRGPQIIDEVRNFLISGPNQRDNLLDLFSLNVQRGRDHGLPSYNNIRKAFGLSPYKNFEQFLGRRSDKLDQFKSVYGHIDQMDLWVGIISQPKVKGAIIGELGGRIIADTFKKLRDGDRFWYEKQYPRNIVNQIKSTELGDIIRRTVPDLFYIQKDIFSLRK